MSADCFYNRLQGLNDDNNLVNYGSGKIIVKKDTTATSSNSFMLILRNTKEFKVKAFGGYISKTYEGLTNDPKTEIDCSAGIDNSIYFENKDFECIVDNLYSQTRIMDVTINIKLIAGINVDEWKYSALQRLRIAGKMNSGNLESLPSTLTHLYIYNTNIEGSIERFRGVVLHSTETNIFSLAASPVEGDISALNGVTGVTTINLNDTNISGDISDFLPENTVTNLSVSRSRVEGSIEDFAQSLADTYASGTIQVGAVGCDVIYNGVAITKALIITYSSGSYTISEVN